MINKKNILAYLMVLSFATTYAALNMHPFIFLSYEADKNTINTIEKAIGTSKWTLYEDTGDDSTYELCYSIYQTDFEKDLEKDDNNKVKEDYKKYPPVKIEKMLNDVLNSDEDWKKAGYCIKFKNIETQFGTEDTDTVFSGTRPVSFKKGEFIDSIDIIIEKKGFLGLSKMQWSLVLIAVIVAGGVAAYMGGMFDEKTEKENNGGGVAETTEKAK